MGIKSFAVDFCDFFKSRISLVLWISLVLYLFYDCFIYYNDGRQFYHLRQILGIGLCISRGTAAVINLCCALILLPLCKKLNQISYHALSKICPGIFFFWLKSAKSFHITVATTLFIFAVIHSISHFANLWNFSRGFDEERIEVNFARFRNESIVLLLMSTAGLTGISMLIILTAMSAMSTRFIRRKNYNAFWYTHQLYLPFLLLLIIHPLSGVLKEEVLDTNEVYQDTVYGGKWSNNTSEHSPKFQAIKSKTWVWMAFPISCYLLDFLWRILSRNTTEVEIVQVNHMAGRTVSLKMRSPPDFMCRMGQYVLLQCLDVSLLEWHPFTVVTVPTRCERCFEVWIRVKGDWTESLEKLLLNNELHNIRILVDGPFSSPMEAAAEADVAVCVAAGVGITPFVSILRHLYQNPRSQLPGRIHLIWIVRQELEIFWIAELANNTIQKLINANRPDRLNIEFYVTNDNNKNNTDNNLCNDVAHFVIINGAGRLDHIVNKHEVDIDEEKLMLLTPNRNRLHGSLPCKEIENMTVKDVAKMFPILGCRMKRGRPYWDGVFGYWVHLYPSHHLTLFCCGPKKLVELLKYKCKITSKLTKLKFSFVHDAFS